MYSLRSGGKKKKKGEKGKIAAKAKSFGNSKRPDHLRSKDPEEDFDSVFSEGRARAVSR